MDRTNALASHAARPAGLGVRLLSRLSRARETIAMWQLRCFERRRLLEMDDHLLKDIGLSRTDAWQEANKPFWQP